MTAHHIRIPFTAAFSHALQHRRETETVIVEVASDAGEVGFGEILPRAYLTGETLSSVLASTLPERAHRWIGQTFHNLDQVLAMLRDELLDAGRALATFTGCELALLDLAGKTFGLPAGNVLGPEHGEQVATGVVIGFNVATETLQRHCMLLRLSGHKYVKVKVGREDDFLRLEIIARILGSDFPLRLDANGAWTAEQAIPFLRRLGRVTIRSVEQPVRADDLGGMRRVREETGIPVVADEALCSISDARRLINASAADIFNIRIGKCGGLLASAELVKLASESGLQCQLGTLVGETGILQSAANIFTRRIKGFDFLEGKGQNNHLLLEDVVSPPPMQETQPTGLGIAVSRKTLARWSASAPLAFHSPAWSPT